MDKRAQKSRSLLLSGVGGALEPRGLKPAPVRGNEDADTTATPLFRKASLVQSQLSSKVETDTFKEQSPPHASLKNKVDCSSTASPKGTFLALRGVGDQTLT